MGETYETPTLTGIGNIRTAEGAELDQLAGLFGVPRKLVPGTAAARSLSDPQVEGMREETDAEMRARLFREVCGG